MKLRDMMLYVCPANDASSTAIGSIQTEGGLTPFAKWLTMIEKTNTSPAALVTNPERLEALLNSPVFARRLFWAEVPFMRLRRVPSIPAIGNASRNAFA